MVLFKASNLFIFKCKKLKTIVGCFLSIIYSFWNFRTKFFILIILLIISHRILHGFPIAISSETKTSSAASAVFSAFHHTYSNLITTIIIISSTYYNTSSMYPKSSAVILFNTLRNGSDSHHWYCISSNKTHKNFKSSIFPKKPFFQTGHCQMKIFAANCTTVLNPTYFALSPLNDSLQKAQLQIRSAITEKLPVVSCVSPLFFNERWQINMFSIEIYAYFGVSRQAYYYMSILENGFLLLKEYEKLRLIDLHPWVVPDVSLMRKGFEFRNQATAHNDCYLLYREAADFIIVHDPDDILLLDNMTNYWTSFVNLNFNFPMVGDLVFHRYNAYANTAETLSETSIVATLKSIKVSNNSAIGKSVYFTRGIESIDSHFATNYKKDYIKKSFDLDVGLFVHIRNLTFEKNMDEKNYNKTLFRTLFYLSNVINRYHFNAIEASFVRRLSAFPKLESLKTLKLTNIYYKLVDDCYERVLYQNPNGPCPSHFLCIFPQKPNIRCLHARNQFFKNNISNLTIFYPDVSPMDVVLNDGCIID